LSVHDMPNISVFRAENTKKASLSFSELCIKNFNVFSPRLRFVHYQFSETFTVRFYLLHLYFVLVLCLLVVSSSLFLVSGRKHYKHHKNTIIIFWLL